MPVFPLSQAYRDHLVRRLSTVMAGRDPATVLEERIFKLYPEEATLMPTTDGPQPQTYYRDIVRHCEMSAWSRRPPLMVGLLKSFEPAFSYDADIEKIKQVGPFQCHPEGQPFWVALVAAQMPLLGRQHTRAAAVGFSRTASQGKGEGVRVLRVNGPCGSGKTYTLRFFKYLEVIQPTIFGVIALDFGFEDLATRAAAVGEPIELLLAHRLDDQMRRQRAVLEADSATGGGPFDLDALLNKRRLEPFAFPPLTDIQQRNRWVKELVDALVDQVLFRVNSPPQFWVIVLDNCGSATPEAQEFVRRLVERAAGTNPTTAQDADKGHVRVVLLGESAAMLPSPVYSSHIYEDDLSQPLGRAEVEQHFQLFAKCRDTVLDAAQLQHLTDTCLERANERMKTQGAPCEWPHVLAEAVGTTTLSLEASLARKKAGS